MSSFLLGFRNFQVILAQPFKTHFLQEQESAWKSETFLSEVRMEFWRKFSPISQVLSSKSKRRAKILVGGAVALEAISCLAAFGLYVKTNRDQVMSVKDSKTTVIS